MATAVDIDPPVDDRPAGPSPDIEQEPGSGGGWQRDRQGREYIAAQGRKGIVYRKGQETPQEALSRDAKRDQRPRKSTTAKKPPRPSKVDLQELEQLLVEALSVPAVPCAMAGDEWAANHFTRQAPVLARNLVVAAEKNPWLLKKLESAASGGPMMAQVMTMATLGGALIGYALPPVVYWLNLPAPDKAREMFGIPPRREPEPEPQRAASPPPPSSFPAAA